MVRKYFAAVAISSVVALAVAQSAPISAPVASVASTPASVAAPTESAAANVPAPDPNSPLEFTEVVQVEGASTAELYTRAKVWFAKAFVSSNHVLEVQDKEAGLLVGKGTFTYEAASFMGSAVIKGHVGFTVKIMVKDGRYKYSITDFIHTGSPAASQFGLVSGVDFGLITNAKEPPAAVRTSAGVRRNNWLKLQSDSKMEAEGLIKSMKIRMLEPSKGADNW